MASHFFPRAVLSSILKMSRDAEHDPLSSCSYADLLLSQLLRGLNGTLCS